MFYFPLPVFVLFLPYFSIHLFDSSVLFCLSLFFFTLCWFVCFHPCNSCVPVPVPWSSCVLCVPTFFLVTAALSSVLFFLGISFACFMLLAFWMLGFEPWTSAHHYGFFDHLWQSKKDLETQRLMNKSNTGVQRKRGSKTDKQGMWGK